MDVTISLSTTSDQDDLCGCDGWTRLAYPDAVTIKTSAYLLYEDHGQHTAVPYPQQPTHTDRLPTPPDARSPADLGVYSPLAAKPAASRSGSSRTSVVRAGEMTMVSSAEVCRSRGQVLRRDRDST